MNLGNDITNTAREPFPLDFHLWDAAQRPVLSSLATDGQTLTLGIRNTARGNVKLNALPAGGQGYHFVLRFRKGALLDPANIRVAGPDPHWERVFPTTPASASDAQEIFLRGPDNHVIVAGETRVLELHAVQAGPGTRTTRVELVYQSLTLAGNDLAGHRQKMLSIIDQEPPLQTAVHQLPLYVGFSGSNTILNDKASKNTLRLQLTNTDAQKKGLHFPATLPARAKIILACDVGEAQQRGWGLATLDELAAIVPELAGGVDAQGRPVNWEMTFTSEAARPQWVFTPPGDGVTLAAGQALALTITEITSSLPSGPANLHLRCENVTGYPDRAYVLTVQKTPLVYGDRLVRIRGAEPEGATPGHALHIEGNDDALRLTGTGANGAGAKLNFGDGELVYLHENEENKLTIRAGKMLVLSSGTVDIRNTGDGTGRLNVDGAISARDATFSTMTGVLNGSDISDKSIARNKLMEGVQQALCPPGTILPYAGDTAPPGWLMCDGKGGCHPDTYPALFDVIGYRFGGYTRHGNHYFKTPDLRGRFLRGRDSEANLDPNRDLRTAVFAECATGDAVGSIQDDALKAHTHTYIGYGEKRGDGGGDGWYAHGAYYPGKNLTGTGDGTTVDGLETRPKNMYVNFIIKV